MSEGQDTVPALPAVAYCLGTKCIHRMGASVAHHGAGTLTPSHIPPTATAGNITRRCACSTPADVATRDCVRCHLAFHTGVDRGRAGISSESRPVIRSSEPDSSKALLDSLRDQRGRSALLIPSAHRYSRASPRLDPATHQSIPSGTETSPNAHSSHRTRTSPTLAHPYKLSTRPDETNKRSGAVYDAADRAVGSKQLNRRRTSPRAIGLRWSRRSTYPGPPGCALHVPRG